VRVCREVAVVILAMAVLLSIACGDEPASDTLEEARLLRQSGRYAQSLSLYEDVIASGDEQIAILLEYAEVAVLAAQSERTTLFRERARSALQMLSSDTTLTEPRAVGELWRRLGWEMVRNIDSLQAFDCFNEALTYDLIDMFEEEWLFRGTFAGLHLEQISGLPDSLNGTPAGDSLLSIAAESYLVELDRIPLGRTDLRESILTARMRLLPFTPRRQEELEVLTELDRLGGIDPGTRLRRIQLLLQVAADDIEMNRMILAREKLMEVWNTDFSGERLEAACLLGMMAEANGDPSDALSWYRRACSIAPSSSAPSAVFARAKRDSLTYNGFE